MTTFYMCNPERNPVCSKKDCGWLKNGKAMCFETVHEEYAALDETGRPFVTNMGKMIEGSDK